MTTERELNDEASWQCAREYGKKLGRFPNVFAAAVRLLVLDHQRNNGELRPVTKFLVSQALRGKKILSMLYYSAIRLKPDEFKDQTTLSLGELVNSYTPYDVASLYAVYLLYRRTRKHNNMDLAAFRELMPQFQSESQLATLVGAAIPKIGIGNGALVGSMHHLALGIIAVSNRDKVMEYNSYLKAKGMRWDQYRETEIFGCTTVQLGSVLLTKLGFSKAVVELYFRGLDQEPKSTFADADPCDPIRFGRLWLDCILDGRDQPMAKVPGTYYPLSIQRDWLQEELTLINSGIPSWFERDNDDVTPEKTPALFSGDAVNKEVPEKLRDIFTLKEIADMGEEEFDALVDEIDKTIEDGTLDQVLSESDTDAPAS